MPAQEMSHSMFMPHGMCFLWSPEILWTHVISDAVIGLSYFSIPAVLAIFTLKRPDLVYRPVIWMFVMFIVSCGITHFFAMWTIWHPDYMAQGIIKAITALISLATAILLWPLLPKLLALPSSQDLHETNKALAEEIKTRQEAEIKLNQLAQELENRVKRRTSALSRSNDALEHFAATVSHDLQAPLRHISMFSQLLGQEEKEQLSDQGQMYLEKIIGSVERMQSLIRVMLDYARLSQEPPNPERTDLNAIITDIKEQYEREFWAKKITITADDIPQPCVDRVLITQVLSNLINNSIKYSEREETQIHITSVPVDDDHIEVRVRDNGVGIPPEFAERIFEMLKRLSNKTEGNGVGLAFCKQIIESHGGKIWLDTEFKDGAQFCFTLPLRDYDH